MPHAELLAIGTELLLGEIVDTNSAYIARALRDIGLNLFYISQIGDNEDRIVQALAGGLRRSDAIITTGGLGPTVDDMTREAVARATGRPLEIVPELLAQIEARFARWGRRMTDNNRRQAMIPQGAIPIPNPVGTAPASSSKRTAAPSSACRACRRKWSFCWLKPSCPTCASAWASPA